MVRCLLACIGGDGASIAATPAARAKVWAALEEIEMPQASFGDLPERLRPVCRLIVVGKHNREIAVECGYAVHTIEKMCSEIYEILECAGGRPELIARAWHGDFGDLDDLGEVSG